MWHQIKDKEWNSYVSYKGNTREPRDMENERYIFKIQGQI